MDDDATQAGSGERMYTLAWGQLWQLERVSRGRNSVKRKASSSQSASYFTAKVQRSTAVSTEDNVKYIIS